MMTANIYGLFCAHRLIYRPFCVQDNSVHSHNLLIYISCIYSFAEHLRCTAKVAEKGRARQGSLPPFRQKFPATALPLFLPHFTSIYH